MCLGIRCVVVESGERDMRQAERTLWIGLNLKFALNPEPGRGEKGTGGGERGVKARPHSFQGEMISAYRPPHSVTAFSDVRGVRHEIGALPCACADRHRCPCCFQDPISAVNDAFASLGASMGVPQSLISGPTTAPPPPPPSYMGPTEDMQAYGVTDPADLPHRKKAFFEQSLQVAPPPPTPAWQ